MKQTLQRHCRQCGIPLTEAMLSAFQRYGELLIDWNSRMNLTAITDPEEIAVKHFLDSLLLLKACEPERGAGLLDVGAGAGFPSLPLKIARPDLDVTMLDSLQKRIGFLEEVTGALGLPCRFLHGRAEDFAHLETHRERYDLVTARAVAALRVLSEYCLPYVKVGGRFLAMKGASVEEELREAENAIRCLGGEVESQQSFTLPDGGKRGILVIRKISRSSPKYPRTPGKITKAPL